MELMPGYKQSDVGVIPEDWNVLPLGECLIGRPSYGINAPAVPYSDALPVYIRITDISEDGRFLPDKLVSVKSEQACNYYLSDGDIVFARTGASVGKSYRYNPNDGKLVFAGFLIRVKPDVTKLLPGFVSAYVKTGKYWCWVRLMSMRSGQPGINGNEYSQLPIPIPQLSEQHAITQALSDADTLLATLDQVIAKKRSLKQAALQQLLTGKTRLPGFRGEWQKKTLGELGTTYGGLTGKTKSDFGFGNAKYITFMNVITNAVLDCTTFEQVNVSASEAQNKVLQGDIIFNSSSETPEEVALCSLMVEQVPNLYLNSFCFGFRLFEDQQVNGLFLTHFIRANPGREMMRLLAQGSTRYNISKSALRKASVLLPLEDEQVAIAEVLSLMDAELDALEARRDKTRNIKLAMMQELLSGRTRLV